MRIHVTRPLFAWDELDDSPSLTTLRAFLEAIPDAPLLDDLRRRRHGGNDRYPVHVLWGVLLLAMTFVLVGKFVLPRFVFKPIGPATPYARTATRNRSRRGIGLRMGEQTAWTILLCTGRCPRRSRRLGLASET